MRFPPPVQQRDARDADTPHLSISQAALATRCPLAWHLKYESGVAPDAREAGANLRIGIALDRACEAWWTNAPPYMLAPAPERHDRAYQHIAALPENLRDKAVAAWHAFLASPVSEWASAPFGVQRRHAWDMGGLTVIGYSDLIRNDSAVVDVKYGGRPTEDAWVRGVIRQMAFYRLSDPTLTAEGRAIIVRFGGRVQPEIIDLHISEGDVADLLAYLDAARADSHDAPYHPARPGAHCGWCDWQTACHSHQVALARYEKSPQQRVEQDNVAAFIRENFGG